MWTKVQAGIERLGAWWCRAQHRAVRWPVHGEYECATCYRRYPVPWAERKENGSSPRMQRAFGNHHSVTIWAQPRHDSKPWLSVF